MSDQVTVGVPDNCPKASKQSEFIAYLSMLVENGNAQDLQEAALAFWSLYPKLSLTFARRVFSALDNLGVPAQRFDPSLLAILARCYLRIGQTEHAHEYLVAARRIMPAVVEPTLVCRVYELEVTAALIHSQLIAAEDAYLRLDGYARANCGGLTGDQFLLGARLYFAMGDLSQASQCCACALERAITDEQRYQAQLTAFQIDGYRDGDVRGELIQLLSLEHAQYVRPRLSLSTETRARLFYRLSRAFLCQGDLAQAALRLRRTGATATGPFFTPEILAGGLALANESLVEARHHLELLERRTSNNSGLSQAERLDRRFGALMLTQMLRGAKQNLDEAEEFYRLCAVADHTPLRCRGALLLASALIAADDHERARDLLREISAQIAGHKMLRLIAEGLLALCHAGDAEPADADFSTLADLLECEDTTFALAFLVHAHPTFLDLLENEGLEEHLSFPSRRLVSTRLARVRRVHKERALAPKPDVKAEDRDILTDLFDFSACRFPSSDHSGRFFSFPCQPVVSHSVASGLDHTLRIQLFGSLQVHRRGNRLDLEHYRRNKVRYLLIMLALARGREVSRDFITTALWPHQQDARSLNNFYVVWNALKKTFLADELNVSARFYSPEQFPFNNIGGRCVLLTEYCDLDLNDFERLVFRIKNAAYQGQGGQCLSLAEELMTIYQDELLPADHESDQLARARRYYQNSFVEIMLLVSRIALKSRQAAAALPLIERGLVADPRCEDLYRLAMHAYVLEGRRDDSLRSYHRCRQYLTDELGIEPSPELTEMFNRLVALSSPGEYPTLELPERLVTQNELKRIPPAAA